MAAKVGQMLLEKNAELQAEIDSMKKEEKYTYLIVDPQSADR
jgi:hypothetical protein